MEERMNLTTLMDLASLCDCMKEEVSKYSDLERRVSLEEK